MNIVHHGLKHGRRTGLAAAKDTDIQIIGAFVGFHDIFIIAIPYRHGIIGGVAAEPRMAVFIGGTGLSCHRLAVHINIGGSAVYNPFQGVGHQIGGLGLKDLFRAV